MDVDVREGKKARERGERKERREKKRKRKVEVGKWKKKDMVLDRLRQRVDVDVREGKRQEREVKGINGGKR